MRKLNTQNIENALRRGLTSASILVAVIAVLYGVLAGKSVLAWPDTTEYVFDGPVASFFTEHPLAIAVPVFLDAVAVGVLVTRKRD